MLAQEVRNYISKQKAPVDFVMRSLSDGRVLGAVLTAPSFLSGLTDVQMNVMRERARAALHPEEAQMQKSLTKALDELREGVAAMKRMLLERCEMSEDDDGQFRSNREPMPGKALAAPAKSAAACSQTLR